MLLHIPLLKSLQDQSEKEKQRDLSVFIRHKDIRHKTKT